VRRFAEFSEDLERVLERVAAEHPGLPHILVGHSMGGLVALEFVHSRHPALAGLVLSGLALDVGERVSARRALAVGVMRRIMPRKTLGSGIDPDGLSTDSGVGAAYREDPLVQRRLTVSLASEFVDAARRIATAGPGVGVPVLLLHGREDPICSVRSSENFAQTLPNARLQVYDGMLHEVFNEPEHEAVFREVLGWILERTPSKSFGDMK
jgi:lysophospholipase